MSDLSHPPGTLEELLAKKKEETGDTKFTPEAARLAGYKSGMARRPIDKEKDARRVYAYIVQTADLLSARIHSGYKACPHCKRGGPIDPRLLATLASELKDYADTILAYSWGRPAQESKLTKAGSIEDYKQAQREANSESNKDYMPEELASIEAEMLETPEPEGEE